MMNELIEKEFINIENDNNENETSKKIKQITPLNIKDYTKEELISLIKKEKNHFFYFININSLKLLDNGIIKSIPKKIISNFTKEILEKLAEAEKIQYMDNKFLTYIDKSVLSQLSDKFFKKINIYQFENAGKDIILNLVTLRKIHYLDQSVIQLFYKKYFNMVKEDEDIKYLLTKSGKKFDYLTLDNFIYLDKFIGKTNKLDYFFEKLKKFRFSEKNENGDINTSFHKGVLDMNDFKDKEQKNIIHDEISERIRYFLTDGEGYEILKDYCIKCLENEDNKQLAIQTLYEILNEPTYDIFKKIDQYKILEILIIIDSNQANQIKNYIRLKKLIKEINELELFDPCEFYQKLIFFSNIINEGYYDDDFLEILAEENLRNMKYLINTFFTGTDKDAIPENLRNQYVSIIKDYMEIIKKKYDIDEDRIINGLSNIVKDKENLEINLNLFLKTLSVREKLFYDLTIQSIIEMPSYEKNVEEKFTILFKFIRDIGLTFAGAKCASLTGSKVLTSISIGIGVAKILKNIKDEVVKHFFRLTDNQKRLYLINHRSAPQTTFRIIGRKIKEGFRKIIIPIKKSTNEFIRKKILKLKNETKVGFDKFIFNFTSTERLIEECSNFRNNNIELYINSKKLLIEPKFEDKLNNIKEKYKEMLPKKQSKKFNEFSRVKENLIKYLIDKRKNKLNKKYPEFADSFSNKVKQKFYNARDFFIGLYNGCVSSITFNMVDLKIKDSKSKLLEKLLNGVKEANYLRELEELKKYERNCNLSTLTDEIRYFVDSSSDKNIFSYLKIHKIQSESHLENLRNYLKSNMTDNTYQININKVSEELENINNDISISTNENFDDKSELLIK